jgi:hypothetical protein
MNFELTLRYSYYACLLFSAIMATINYAHLRSRQISLFVPYLWLVLIQELCIYFLIVLPHPTQSTGIYYNIYRLVSTSFFAFIFYNIISDRPLRRLILLMFGFFSAIALLTYFFIQPITIFNSYLSTLGGIVITSCGLFFLFNFFNLDSSGEEKKWSPLIWITIGLATFYPVVNISFAFYKYILVYEATIFNTMLYNAIPRIMSIFMYGCFAYAFYLCRKKN